MPKAPTKKAPAKKAPAKTPAPKAPAAKAFVEEHASELNLSYEELMGHADEYVRSGDYYVGGAEAEGYCIPEEFWEHWELITGRTTDGRRGNFIGCSC